MNTYHMNRALRDLNSPEFKRRFYQIGISTAILSGIIVLGVHSLGNYLSKHEFVPKDRMAVVERIDRDELSDFVVGDKIFLANQIEQGIVYTSLRDSDLYRIK